MKLDLYVAKSIRDFPTLFRDVTYEKSRIKVLDQLFLVNGNGLEWKNGTLEDRYKTTPKMAKQRAEERGEDYVPKSHMRSTKFEPDYFMKPILVIRKLYTDENGVVQTYTQNQESTYAWVPYSICEYAKLVNIPKNVQKDWLEGAIETYQRTVEFWNQDYDTLDKLFTGRRGWTREQQEKYLAREIEEQKAWLDKAGKLLALRSKAIAR